MTEFLLETNRCYLRPFAPSKEDIDLIYNLRTDKDICISMGIPPISKEKALEIQSRYDNWLAKYGFTNFAVFDKETNEFIGSCGCSLFHDPDGDRNPLPAINGEKYEFRDIEIGYVLHKKFWGKGYGTELAKACIDFVFKNNLDVKRIVAVTVPNNIASQKILAKIGFKFEVDIESKEYGKEKFFVKLRDKNY